MRDKIANCLDYTFYETIGVTLSEVGDEKQYSIQGLSNANNMIEESANTYLTHFIVWLS